MKKNGGSQTLIDGVGARAVGIEGAAAALVLLWIGLLALMVVCPASDATQFCFAGRAGKPTSEHTSPLGLTGDHVLLAWFGAPYLTPVVGAVIHAEAAGDGLYATYYADTDQRSRWIPKGLLIGVHDRPATVIPDGNGISERAYSRPA